MDADAIRALAFYLASLDSPIAVVLALRSYVVEYQVSAEKAVDGILKVLAASADVVGVDIANRAKNGVSR